MSAARIFRPEDLEVPMSNRGDSGGTEIRPALAREYAPADVPVVVIPETAERPPLEERIQRVISLALLVGVLLSAGMVLLGGCLYVARHATTIANYSEFRGTTLEMHRFTGVVRAVLRGSGTGIIQLGFMLLIGVQVVRVVLAGVLFALQRDRIFIGITGVVFLLLMFGIVKGTFCCR